MGQFLRMIDHSIIDFFVQQAEDTRYCGDQFLKDSPYLLGNRDLDCLFGYFPKKSSDCLVVAEAFCNGKDIVLYAAQCSRSNLRGEIGALAFTESKIGLAVLEYYFKGPAPGICLSCLEEIHSGVGCEQAVPFAVLRPAHKEYPYRYTSESGIKHDIAAFEFSAVILQFEFFAKFHKCRCREITMFGMIFSLAVLSDLHHAEPMASDTAAMYEPDNLLIGKPAVGQYITEPQPPSDSPLYHLFGEFYLGHVVFLLPLTEHLAVVLGRTASVEFLRAHAVVAPLSLLSDNCEIKKNLRNSIGGRHTEAFEAQHCLVGKMRMDSSYPFNSPARLLMVGVVKNQTYVICLMVGSMMYPVPQLYRYVPECLSPVNVGIFHESVENILSGLYQRFESAVFLIAVSVFYSKTGEKQKTLEHSEQPVHAVALACYGKCVALCHPDLSEDRTYVVHSCRHIRFFKKVFDIREKRSNFVYRHGFELVFWWYLKLLIFLQISKKPCRFFIPLSPEISTCET